ncbi:MAG: SAP domain-containing protein [Gammaproteobacteria bacterium]|nr:SAP domain-containing protein [Gammaproteobacteria bacterium]
MKVKEIKIIAHIKGIKHGKLTKAGLIHLIQKEEGSDECYATSAVTSCEQDLCLWREDCIKTV